jgi:tRNA A-37 threonylcarbamoyl transferase component Bud32
MHAVMGGGRLIAGRYRLQGPIGRGAMGIVWRGRDELLARDVAVKEVQITGQASPADAETIYQRTLREARAAASINHPGAVTVFDVVEENGSPWIVMELLKGRPLDRVITEDGPLPPLRAAELGGSLVGALATAHAAGVLHRDVKPGNVLVTDDGRAVLTDFGIATFSGDPRQTQVGMVVGTPGFTAPERLRGDVATPASDLWSLGATLFAAVEGRGPFDRAGGPTVITAGIAKEDAPRAPSAGPLGPVIEALLSRDPSTRPDAVTASRLLAEATAAAEVAAAAGPAEHYAVMDPPVFAELSMPEPADPPDDVKVSLVSVEPLGFSEMLQVAPDDFVAVGPDATALGAAAVVPALAGPDAVTFGSPPMVPANVAADAVGLDAPGLDAPGLHAPGLDAIGLGSFSLGSFSLGAISPDGGAGLGTTGTVAVIGGAGSETAGGSQQTDHGDGGPVLWQPLRRVPGGPEGVGAATGDAGSSPGGPGGGFGSGGSGSGGSGDGRFLRGGPARPKSVRWQLLLAAAGIAVIAAAAGIGWYLYSTPTTQGLQNPTAPSTNVQGGGSGAANHGSSGSGSSGTHSGGAPGLGGSGPTTTSKSEPQGNGKPASTPSSGPGGSSAPSSPSSSPSPSPSPSVTGPVLPPGYVWHRFSAAVLGSTAGFEIGLPSLWKQSVSGQSAYLVEPVTNFHLTVDLAAWTYAAPLTEAQYLERQYAKIDKGFKLLTLGAIGFKAIGGFKAAPAAELKFSWTRTSAGTVTELVALVSLTTKSGVQPYSFTLWAPPATFGVANGVFRIAMTTFRPLPG